MKVMVIVKATDDSEAGKMPSEQMLRDMGAFNEALVNAGIMLTGDGLKPSSAGARVFFSGKDRSVVNGPFAETKELIAGFWIWQVKSMDEAIAWVKRCPNPMIEDSVIEIRPMFTMEDFAESDPTGELAENERKLAAELEKNQLDGPRFENLRPKVIAGLSLKFTPESTEQIPHLFEKLCPYMGDIPGQVGNNSFGVCYRSEKDEGMIYLAGVEVSSANHLPPDFTHVNLPAQRYAIFNHHGPVSKIKDTFAIIHSKWLPNSGYQAASAPMFEKYTEAFNPETGMDGIELWVPIQKL